MRDSLGREMRFDAENFGVIRVVARGGKMTDAEVGELWANYHDNSRAETICDLIRKLVEERAKQYGPSEVSWVDARVLRALSDFRIDPATWPKE